MIQGKETYSVLLDRDHPGFSDPDYRIRRDQIAQQAIHYTYPDTVPRVDYIDEEHMLWRDIRHALHPVHVSHAWSGYLDALQHSRLSNSRIPQLQDINDRLKLRTGFQLVPVEGLIESRRFLSGLADSKMLCTQYIRHHSVPHYTPEPDVVHELIGHVVSFFTEDYCDLNR